MKNGRNGIEWLRGKAFAKPDGDSGKNPLSRKFWFNSRFNFQGKTTVFYKEKAVRFYSNCLILCDPRGARTHDPNIKSVVLYQLS